MKADQLAMAIYASTRVEPHRACMAPYSLGMAFLSVVTQILTRLKMQIYHSPEPYELC